MLFIDGYPVEYRAFVENGRLLGVSSYYPQRPLPRNDRQLQTVEDLVDALLDALSGPFEWPAIKHEALGIRKMATALGKRTPDPDWSWPSSAHRLRLSLLPGLSALASAQAFMNFALGEAGNFPLVPHHVRQRGLDHLPRVVGPFRRPIPEAGPEAMRHRRDSQLL